jgi:hypothetical protein
VSSIEIGVTVKLPTEFFSQSTILTLAGASGAVYVVTSALQHALNYNPRWLALLLSIVLGIVGVAATQAPTLVDYMVGLVNGCLIYCTTVGINSMSAKSRPGGRVSKGVGDSPIAVQHRTFRSRWF